MKSFFFSLLRFNFFFHRSFWSKLKSICIYALARHSLFFFLFVLGLHSTRTFFNIFSLFHFRSFSLHECGRTNLFMSVFHTFADGFSYRVGATDWQKTANDEREQINGWIWNAYLIAKHSDTACGRHLIWTKPYGRHPSWQWQNEYLTEYVFRTNTGWNIKGIVEKEYIKKRRKKYFPLALQTMYLNISSAWVIALENFHWIFCMKKETK